MDLDKLKALWYDINEYGEYLKNATYSPYNKVQSFANRLRSIIESDGNKLEETNVYEEVGSPEEYFDEWFAYGAPEEKTYRMCFEEGIKYNKLLEKKKAMSKQVNNVDKGCRDCWHEYHCPMPQEGYDYNPDTCPFIKDYDYDAE